MDPQLVISSVWTSSQSPGPYPITSEMRNIQKNVIKAKERYETVLANMDCGAPQSGLRLKLLPDTDGFLV
jgi:hypothetical protein